MDASLIARLKELEVENARLKKRMPCQKSGSAAWAQSVGLSLY
jgi:hypothetical protein